ncbi:hypothetical protein [uncultured Phenylobacterium sp.]|uniref:hypothetical protein n=1 Tax=uncultured Phenylobacterium sp. TaxID=349273 RepID=UPI0025DDAC8B|nr:hypothetical protein [uncultured Phenylobacterium sp.]
MPLNREMTGLVRQHIRSVWTLELLLLMRSRPDYAWSAPELVQELRASSYLVASNLEGLTQAGLVLAEDESRYRYAPANDVLAAFADAVEAAYRQRPVAIINLISAPEDPVQALADAFKLKGRDR